MNATLIRLRQRLLDILARHVDTEDEGLSDDAFVRKVMVRYEKSREDYLIDPNE